MGVNTQRYIRKPLYVDAVRVTAANFDEIVAWCQGEVQTDEVEGTGTTKKFIKVRVHNPKNPRQTKAFIGDWILYTDRGYKVYTNKAFRAAFDLVEEIEVEEESVPSAEPGSQLMDAPPPGGDMFPPTPPVETAVEEHTTPQGEPHEYVEATPEAIAEVVDEQQSVDPEEASAEETSEPVSEQEVAEADKRVLSEEEQKQMGPDEVRELVQSGEAVLAQDLAESA